MTTPQDSPKRKKQKIRRSKQLAEWREKQAKAGGDKAPAAKAPAAKKSAAKKSTAKKTAATKTAAAK